MNQPEEPRVYTDANGADCEIDDTDTGFCLDFTPPKNSADLTQPKGSS